MKDNSNEPIKDIKWQKDYSYTSDDFMLIPVCPSCGELAYEEQECVFCHQKYRYTPKPKGYEDTVIAIEDYTITQVFGSWGVYIEHNGQLLSHASCTKQLSKKELTNWLKKYIKENKNETNNIKNDKNK